MKIGDKVQIINPELYIRTGYKIGKEESKRLLLESFKNKGTTIYDELSKIFPFLKTWSGSSTMTPHWKMEKLVEELAFLYNQLELGFGGPERVLFKETYDNIKGLCGTITDRKVVVTGTRIQGSGGDDPTCLVDQNRHVMFRLDIEWPKQIQKDAYDLSFSRLVPVEIYIEKVPRDGYWFEKKDLEVVSIATI